MERINISNKSLVEYEKLGLSFRCESDSMDVRLRVVDASVGFRTFFDSVSFRLLRDAAKIIQENHYYPFGQNMVGIEEKDQQSLSSQEEQKFQYNAKEKLDEFGLYWNDHGARNLDLQTGRWTSVDPLAEKFSHQSPYCGMDNNPVNLSDPTGMASDPPWWSLKGLQNGLSAAKNAVSNTASKATSSMQKLHVAMYGSSVKTGGLVLEATGTASTPTQTRTRNPASNRTPNASEGTAASTTTTTTQSGGNAQSSKPSSYAAGKATVGLELVGTGDSETNSNLTVKGEVAVEGSVITVGATMNTLGKVFGIEGELFGGFVARADATKLGNDSKLEGETTQNFSINFGNLKIEHLLNNDLSWKETKFGLSSDFGFKFSQFTKFTISGQNTTQVTK